jgi:hypothetical protein
MKNGILIFAMLLSLLCMGQNKETFSDALKKSFIQATDNNKITNADFYNFSATQLQSFRYTRVGTIETFDTRYQGLKGSQYLYNEWKKGAVMILGYDKPSIAFMNLDCINDQLIFRHQDGEASAFSRELVSSFAIQDSSMNDQLAYFLAIPDKKGKTEYHQVLYSKGILILQHHRRILRKADYQRAYNPDVRYDEYVRIDEYFAKRGEAEPEKIQFSRKTIESLLPEMKEQITTWSKSNGSKLKTEGELVGLLQHLESLN